MKKKKNKESVRCCGIPLKFKNTQFGIIYTFLVIDSRTFRKSEVFLLSELLKTDCSCSMGGGFTFIYSGKRRNNSFEASSVKLAASCTSILLQFEKKATKCFQSIP